MRSFFKIITFVFVAVVGSVLLVSWHDIQMLRYLGLAFLAFCSCLSLATHIHKRVRAPRAPTHVT